MNIIHTATGRRSGRCLCLRSNLENGFKLRGKVSHLDDYEEATYYWNSPSAVQRSLFMDDVLYTISQRKIVMNDLTNMSEINSISLPFDKSQYYSIGKPVPRIVSSNQEQTPHQP